MNHLMILNIILSVSLTANVFFIRDFYKQHKLKRIYAKSFFDSTEDFEHNDENRRNI